MPLVVLALVLIFPFALLAAVPLSLALRYRAGTARRMARGWVAAINVSVLSVSVAFFLLLAATMSLWVPRALMYTTLGLAGGIVLGLVGIWLSRWEMNGRNLYYTPSRWLVLAMILIVASRMVYGFLRAWHARHATPAEMGAGGSLAAGAVVLGYYLTYNAGVWRRFRLHRGTFGVSDGQ